MRDIASWVPLAYQAEQLIGPKIYAEVVKAGLESSIDWTRVARVDGRLIQYAVKKYGVEISAFDGVTVVCTANDRVITTYRKNRPTSLGRRNMHGRCAA